MAKDQDLSQLGDDELLEQWTAAAQLLDETKADCKAFSEEFHKREQARQDEEKAERRRQAEAGERDASLDQTAGSI